MRDQNNTYPYLLSDNHSVLQSADPQSAYPGSCTVHQGWELPLAGSVHVTEMDLSQQTAAAAAN